MKRRLQKLIPPGIGILAAALLSALYLGIVSWAESPQHALDLFWEDRWLVIPILLGFGVQAGLYTVLKMRLHIPELPARPGDLDGKIGNGASVGAGGATSTVAMVACCVHHVADALPILGLTAAATFQISNGLSGSGAGYQSDRYRRNLAEYFPGSQGQPYTARYIHDYKPGSMKKPVKKLIPLGMILALALVACAPSPASSDKASGQPANSTEIPIEQATLPAWPTETIVPTQPAATPILPATNDLAREDSQGNVVVVITPLNLDSASETLEFDVSMNTHSVDLSMDLAVLATLTTDAELTVTPIRWTGQLGGHHVEGTLSFPSSADGKPILDAATTMTITLRNVDAPERIFTWQLATK